MLRQILVAATGLAASLMVTPQTADAQEKYLGEIILVGMNFCPRGTAPANGQLLPISENSALFSLFGTYYGGDGRTTFALPDLRGRTPVSAGQGPGQPNVSIGQKGQSKVAGEITFPSAGVSVNETVDRTLGMTYCVVTQGLYPSRN